ncbi:MAG TPA: tRNA lysidine(34) synthetase TilS [Verrucomicrobiota bacterium]|nr:tRNA lysidine(34) synthetase TilS [Verrucomicrobiota bacterium]
MPARRKELTGSNRHGNTQAAFADSQHKPFGQPLRPAVCCTTHTQNDGRGDRSTLSDDLEEAVRRAILESRLIPKGATVVVAASGGPDSMVLLRLLAGFAHDQHWRLVVAHFNHLLRGHESDLDEALVASEAHRLGLVFERGEGDVKSHAKQRGLSIEMAARELRHSFLVDIARRYSARCIALGHHADDQIETVILRMLRGCGTEGLRGMKPSSPSEIDKSVLLVRPLLGISRKAIENYAVQERIPFRRDSSNAATDIARNWVRQRLLPLLERRGYPSVREAIRRMADLVGAEADFVTDAARKLLVRSRRPQFGALHCAVQRRLIQLQLRELGVPERHDLIEALRSAAEKPVTAPGGICLWRDAAGLIHRKSPVAPGFNRSSVRLALNGTTGKAVFDGVTVQWRITTKRISRSDIKRVVGREYFDADSVGSEVVLRHWLPGDRFRPIGMHQSAKLQDIFVNARVPRPDRYNKLVAESPGHGIFWVEDLRIGDKFKVRPDTRRILEWRWTRVTLQTKS